MFYIILSFLEVKHFYVILNVSIFDLLVYNNFLFNYFIWKDAGKNRKRGRPCPMSFIVEETTTNKPQTGNFKVSSPSTMKGKE